MEDKDEEIRRYFEHLMTKIDLKKWLVLAFEALEENYDLQNAFPFLEKEKENGITLYSPVLQRKC